MPEIENQHPDLERSSRSFAEGRERLTARTFDVVESVVPKQTYRSFWGFMAMSIVLAISSFQFGYALCEISTVSIQTLIDTFHIPMSPGLTNGLLVGIMPVGGIFGCLLNRMFLIWFSRKNAHFAVSALNILSTVLEQITTVQTIIIGRFILGMCCGIYTAIAPQYIKEVSPLSLRPLFGSFFSMGRVIGIVFCYAIGLGFQLGQVQGYWRIMFAVPGGLAILQSILIFFFVPNSPVEMLEKQQPEELKQYVTRYYKRQIVEHVIKQYTIEFDVQQKALKQAKNQAHAKAADPLSKNKKRAFLMSVHLNIYRQMMGVNTIVAFAGQMVGSVDPKIGPYVNLMLNGIQSIFTAISTFWLGVKFGRRPLYLSSGVICAISCYMIAVGYLINIEAIILAFMLLYMIIFGLLFAPVSWSYPTEIIPPTVNTIATTFTWISLAITTLIPPIVLEAMDQNGYPIFLYFGVYITISLIYMWRCLIESKGRKYVQIIQKY